MRLERAQSHHIISPRTADVSSSIHVDKIHTALELYPDAQLALQLWNIFVKSVDPVLKILHIPTIQSTVIATIMDPRSAQSSTLALTFSIYYAAVTAISHDESSDSIGVSWDKPALLERYKTALDLLLTMTDLMKRPEIRLLQALAIYTVSGRNTDLTHLTNIIPSFRTVCGPMKSAQVYGFSMD